MNLLAYMAKSQAWQTMVFRSREGGEMLGMASYMRIRPEAGSAEVGSVVFSKRLQRTPAATEAMFDHGQTSLRRLRLPTLRMEMRQ